MFRSTLLWCWESGRSETFYGVPFFCFIHYSRLMKETTSTPVSYELDNQRKNVADTLNLLVDQSCELLKNTCIVVCNSSFVQKTIQVMQMTCVLVTVLYFLNLIALVANYFAAALGGTPSLSIGIQYQLFTAGLWFTPVTAFIAISFLKKVF